MRLPGVLSIASKIAQGEGRVLETVLRKGASVTILPNITSRNCTGERAYAWKGGPMLGKGASITISLRQRAFTN